jgi:hypothetical protein
VLTRNSSANNLPKMDEDALKYLASISGDIEARGCGGLALGMYHLAPSSVNIKQLRYLKKNGNLDLLAPGTICTAI